MKQFLVFAGKHFYPLGGWDDMCGAFDTLELATEEWARQLAAGAEWCQTIDVETGLVVESHGD